METYKYLSIFAVALSATACSYTNHFFDEDDSQDDNALYATLKDVNNSAYDSWTYVNLQTGETEVHPDASEWYYAGDGSIREAQEAEDITIDWHIAIHRYELKTNNAMVLNTGETDILSVVELPEGTYSADETATYEDEAASETTSYLLVMDMSGMMSGNIGYAHYPVINRVLCDGITRTATGSMPPTVYGTTGEVFALKWEDGSWVKLQITGTYSEGSTSGYLSFNYKYYPAE